MKPIDGHRVRAAIACAENGTSARIAVRVTDEAVSDALAHAREQFHGARLHEHPDRNAVLFLVAPKSRKFAVYGGSAIHERVGEPFWQRLVTEMTPLFAQDRATDGLLLGIERAGEQLRIHFPRGTR